MRPVDLARMIVMALFLNGLVACGQSGEEKAKRWINMQAEAPMPSLPPVPMLIDTPPANFTSKADDLFSPERISGRFRTAPGSNANGVIFPDAPVSELSLLGFISANHSSRVAIVRYRSEYRSIRKGNLVSEQVLLVKEVGDQELVLSSEGLPDQKLVRGK